jgi:hypothetical protein
MKMRKGSKYEFSNTTEGTKAFMDENIYRMKQVKLTPCYVVLGGVIFSALKLDPRFAGSNPAEAMDF